MKAVSQAYVQHPTKPPIASLGGTYKSNWSPWAKPLELLFLKAYEAAFVTNVQPEVYYVDEPVISLHSLAMLFLPMVTRSMMYALTQHIDATSRLLDKVNVTNRVFTAVRKTAVQFVLAKHLQHNPIHTLDTCKVFDCLPAGMIQDRNDKLFQAAVSMERAYFMWFPLADVVTPPGKGEVHEFFLNVTREVFVQHMQTNLEQSIFAANTKAYCGLHGAPERNIWREYNEPLELIPEFTFIDICRTWDIEGGAEMFWLEEPEVSEESDEYADTTTPAGKRLAAPGVRSSAKRAKFESQSQPQDEDEDESGELNEDDQDVPDRAKSNESDRAQSDESNEYEPDEHSAREQSWWCKPQHSYMDQLELEDCHTDKVFDSNNPAPTFAPFDLVRLVRRLELRAESLLRQVRRTTLRRSHEALNAKILLTTSSVQRARLHQELRQVEAALEKYPQSAHQLNCAFVADLYSEALGLDVAELEQALLAARGGNNGNILDEFLQDEDDQDQDLDLDYEDGAAAHEHSGSLA